MSGQRERSNTMTVTATETLSITVGIKEDKAQQDTCLRHSWPPIRLGEQLTSALNFIN